MAKTHFSIEEKIAILQKELSWYYSEQVKKIAAMTDSFTFADLKILVKALRIIAKGKS